MVAIQPGARYVAVRDRPITRKQFLRRGAALAGGVAGLSLLPRLPAEAAPGGVAVRRNGDPNPIPGGFDQNFRPVPVNPLVHVLPPAIGFDMSTITDFNGVVAAAEIQGGAIGSDGSRYTFDADMRFMKGVYIDVNGRRQEHAFGFV